MVVFNVSGTSEGIDLKHGEASNLLVFIVSSVRALKDFLTPDCKTPLTSTEDDSQSCTKKFEY